jgi:hypothetical protein
MATAPAAGKMELLNKQNSGALGTALRAQAVAEHQDRPDLKMPAAEVLAKAAAALRRYASGRGGRLRPAASIPVGMHVLRVESQAFAMRSQG